MSQVEEVLNGIYEAVNTGNAALLDASLEIASRHWSAGPYARNLTNESYITATSSFPPPAIGGRPGEPRQVGVRVAVRRGVEAGAENQVLRDALRHRGADHRRLLLDQNVLADRRRRHLRHRFDAVPGPL